MTHLTLDCFDMINIPSEERFLSKPEDAEEYIEEMPKYDNEEESFRVVFRPN